MKDCKATLRVLAVVLAFACIATAADAPKLTFKFTTLKGVPKAQQTSMFGINNKDVVVGYYLDQKGIEHGVRWDPKDKKFTTIDDPKGDMGSECINLNSIGTIVGGYYTANSLFGFVYKDGKISDIGPAGVVSEAWGINDKGEIVGFVTDSNNVVHGYFWDGKKYTILDYPGANNFTAAWGINNAGLVTLQWIDSSGNYEAALYNTKTKKYSKPITVPGAAQTYVHSINNAGDIVFSWYDSSGNAHGALRIGKTFYTFSDPKGPNYTKSDGINDKREIVGRFEPTGSKFEKSFEATY
jgi:probable HAF family extracellular repeat protein